jgi:hypothetical protein
MLQEMVLAVEILEMTTDLQKVLVAFHKLGLHWQHSVTVTGTLALDCTSQSK